MSQISGAPTVYDELKLSTMLQHEMDGIKFELAQKKEVEEELKSRVTTMQR